MCCRAPGDARPGADRTRPLGTLPDVKEDVLEQIVDDYLQFRGYFTTHNVRFKPRRDHPEYESSQDSVPSDVDVVGYHPKLAAPDRVIVVSCKAWQGGFDGVGRLAQLRGDRRNPSRPIWRAHRELWVPKWSEAFRAAIHNLTAETTFAYRLAVTRLRSSAADWTTDPTIVANLAGSTFGVLTLEEMWSEVLAVVTTTPAPSEIGRLAQLLKAAGLTAPVQVAAPAGPEPGSDADLAEQAESENGS
jgi:hypothetical protein